MKNKPEFMLAISIFVGISIIGTIFALWFATAYSPTSRTNVQGQEMAPPPQAATPPAETDKGRTD